MAESSIIVYIIVILVVVFFALVLQKLYQRRLRREGTEFNRFEICIK